MICLQVSIISILKPTNGFPSQNKSQSSSHGLWVNYPHPHYFWFHIQLLFYLIISPHLSLHFFSKIPGMSEDLCPTIQPGMFFPFGPTWFTLYHFFSSLLESHLIRKVFPLRILYKWYPTIISHPVLFFFYSLPYNIYFIYWLSPTRMVSLWHQINICWVKVYLPTKLQRK